MSAQVMSLAQYKCKEVKRPALSGIVLPPATDTFQPIGHDWLLSLVEKGIREVGLKFGHEHHGLSKDGNRYFGLIELVNGTANNDYSLMMGIRNALDKKFAAQLAFGNRVMVCANLSFFGQYMLGRKHTPLIKEDLPLMIEKTLEHIPGLRKIQDDRFGKYQDTSISSRRADHIIMNMLRQDVIVSSQVKKVVQEWDEPTFAHGKQTMWRLFNAATQTLKGVNIDYIPYKTMRLQQICDKASGFKVAA